ANTLFALWDDPDVAPLRSALAENLFKDSGTDKALGDRAAGNSKQAVTREEMEEYAALIENPFVLGYYAEPDGARARNVSLQTPGRGGSRTWPRSRNRNRSWPNPAAWSFLPASRT